GRVKAWRYCERDRISSGALVVRSRMATDRVPVGLLSAEPRRPSGSLHLISGAAKRLRLQRRGSRPHGRGVSLGVWLVLSGTGDSGRPLFQNEIDRRQPGAVELLYGVLWVFAQRTFPAGVPRAARRFRITLHAGRVRTDGGGARTAVTLEGDLDFRH